MEKRQRLIQRLQDLGYEFKESIKERIVFLQDGQVVGENFLPNYTMNEQRFILADMLDIKEFDDFHLVKADGTIIKASETIIDGMLNSGLDSRESIAEASCREYQRYLKNEKEPRCKCCGKVW